VSGVGLGVSGVGRGVSGVGGGVSARFPQYIFSVPHVRSDASFADDSPGTPGVGCRVKDLRV